VRGRSTRAGNPFRDGSNELVYASIDSLIRSFVDFDRLVDGIFNSSVEDRVRVEIAKHANLPSADRKSGPDGAGLVLVHDDDQFGFVYQLGRDDLRLVKGEVDVPGARNVDCHVGGWSSGANEPRGFDPMFLAEKAVQVFAE
jgi:hypothetical protein